MTADEIRQINDSINEMCRVALKTPTAAEFGIKAVGAKILVEIAAQLAELNHKLTPAGKAEMQRIAAQIEGKGPSNEPWYVG